MERKTKGGRGPGKEVQYGMNYGRKEEGRKVKQLAQSVVTFSHEALPPGI